MGSALGEADKWPRRSRPAGGRGMESVVVTAESPQFRTTSSTIATLGSASEIADLFQYTIHDPVNVKKHESAMLPFLQQKIAARKLIIYSDTSRTTP